MTSDWLLQLGHRNDVYVLPEFRVVYVSVAKNACTSIKWVIGTLAHEDVAHFTAGLSGEVSDEHAVHLRNKFVTGNAWRADEVPIDMRATIRPDRGWFIFTVLRDPWTRFFSAWLEKILMQGPGYRWLREEDWYPSIPRTAGDIMKGFHSFAAAYAGNERLANDPHFRSQRSIILPESVPYSRIYPIDEMDALRRDLESHVAVNGWKHGISFPRFNETPLHANAQVYTPTARAHVERAYADDFLEWGQGWSFDDIENEPTWSEAAIQEVRVAASLRKRLGDVRGIALTHKRNFDHERTLRHRAEKELALYQHFSGPKPLRGSDIDEEPV
jgi:hypothetical protein